MFKTFTILLAVVTFGCAHQSNNNRMPNQVVTDTTDNGEITLPTKNLCTEENHDKMVEIAEGASARRKAFDKKYPMLSDVEPHNEVVKAIKEFRDQPKVLKAMYLKMAIDKAISICQLGFDTNIGELIQEKAIQEGMDCGFGDMESLGGLQSKMTDMRLNYCFRSLEALTPLDTEMGMKNVPLVARYPQGKTPQQLDDACQKEYEDEAADGGREAVWVLYGCKNSWRSDYMATIIKEMVKFKSAIPEDDPL